jgi:hypothetical protein
LFLWWNCVNFVYNKRCMSVGIKWIYLIKLTRKVRQVSMHLQEIVGIDFRIEKIYIKRYKERHRRRSVKRVISTCRWTLLYECRLQAGVQRAIVNDYETYMSYILCCSSINLYSLVVQLYTYSYNNNELGKKKSICQSWKNMFKCFFSLFLLLCIA